jgi:hypothetical protein
MYACVNLTLAKFSTIDPFLDILETLMIDKSCIAELQIV